MRGLFSLMAIAVVFPSFLSGCGTSTMHYYQLTPVALSAEQTAEPLPDLAVGVGPITIPEILKRQEVVARVEENKLRVASQHRWGGMLEKDLTAAITENLGRQLGTDQVLSFPWMAYFNPDYRVVIEILDLTGNPDNLVTLRVGWAIIDGTGKQMLLRKISTYQQPAAEPSVNAMVEAQSQLIARFCQEINTALRQAEL